jgi:hypothetical protein
MWTKFFIALSVACLLIIVSLIARSAIIALDAEKTLHAYFLVLDVVAEYCNSHSGIWPKSWDDLTQARPSRDHSIWTWPKDASQIEERITINFQTTLSEVLTTDPSEFRAISQRDPSYSITPAEIAAFISSIKPGSVRHNEVPKNRQDRD